jgi:hypothetical protein
MPIPVSTQALEVFNLNQSFLAVVAVLGSDHSSRNLMFRVVLAGFQDFQNLTSRRVLWVVRKRRMSGDSRRMRGNRHC